MSLLAGRDKEPRKGCLPLCMAPQSPGRARGREGGICLGTDVTPLLAIHLEVQQHLEGHSAPPQTPRTKQCLLVAWLTLHPPIPCAKAAVFLSLGESQAAVCSMTVVWLTSQSVLLLSFLSWQTDEWNYLAERGFF